MKFLSFCRVVAAPVAGILASFFGSAPVQAQSVLFEESFNSSTLDAQKWTTYNKSYFIHRTQFGGTPELISDGETSFARLHLNTFNADPTYGSSYVKGTELFSQSTFPLGRGGVEFEARVRNTNLAPGLVGAFYTFGAKGVWPTTYLWDEVDYEFLGNYAPDRLWLNVWDDYNPQRGGLNEASQPSVPGLNRLAWNTYKVRAYDYVTQWFVNDVLVRQSTNITPIDAMGLRFNIWAPDFTWTAAYSDSITPSANAASNQNFYFDVDYAKVTALPVGSIGTGTGLNASYFNNIELTGPSVSRLEPRVNFDWADGSPDAAISQDGFSARWQGQVQAQFSETYTFTTRSDDGVRLWVNGQKLVDNWTDHGPIDDSATITLVAGTRYSIVMEFYDRAFGATAQLFWSSPSTPRRIIPSTQLYPTQIVTPTPTPVATATPIAPSSGSGLSATYFNNIDFTGSSVSRTDATINFDWGNASPAAAIGNDSFSARWTGKVVAPFSQPYTFFARADDGVRVWIGGEKIIDAWRDQGPTEYSGTIALVAGVPTDIVVEYYENAFGATAQLRWSSLSTPKAIVPQSQLFPANVVVPTPTPTSPPVGAGNGTGLSAAYFNNTQLSGTPITRTDATVDFDWGDNAPLTSIGVNNWSVRWTGQVQAQYSQLYTFTTRSDDGVRLWVNNQKLIDNWTQHGPTEDSGSIALTAGVKYDIRLEFFEQAFGATMQLSWSSDSTQRSIVPQSQLFPQSVASPARIATAAGAGNAAPRTPPATVRPGVLSVSSGSILGRQDSIFLRLNTPLLAAAANNPRNYAVIVDGVRVPLEAVSYNAARQMLTIRVADGSLTSGAKVRVLWGGLRDSRNRALAIGAWQGVVN